MVALFRMNGRQYLIQNGMNKQCAFGSNELLSKLMAESQYEIDTSVCIGSLFTDGVRQKHLKYHAEKKALAVLLNEDDDDDMDLSVTVSMKMCRDCHNFI